MLDQAITAVVIGVIVYFMVEQVHGGSFGLGTGRTSDSKAVGAYAVIVGVALLFLQNSNFDLNGIFGEGNEEGHVGSFQALILVALAMNLFTWMHFKGITTKQCLSMLTNTHGMTHSVHMQSETSSELGGGPICCTSSRVGQICCASSGLGPICCPASFMPADSSYVQADVDVRSTVSMRRRPPPILEPPPVVTVHVKRNIVNEDITMEKPLPRPPPPPPPPPKIKTRVYVENELVESDEMAVNDQTDTISVNSEVSVIVSGPDGQQLRPRPRQTVHRQTFHRHQRPYHLQRQQQAFDTISSEISVSIQSGDGQSYNLNDIVHLNVEDLNTLAEQNKFRYDVFLNSVSITTSVSEDESSSSEFPEYEEGATISVSSSFTDGESEFHSDVQVDVRSGRTSPHEEVIYFEPVAHRRPRRHRRRTSEPLSICTEYTTYVEDCRPPPKPRKKRRNNQVSVRHEVSQPKPTRRYEPYNDNDSSISVEAEVTRYQGRRQRKVGRRRYDDESSSVSIQAEMTSYQGPKQRKVRRRRYDDSSSISVEAEVTSSRYQGPRQRGAGRRSTLFSAHGNQHGHTQKAPLGHGKGGKKNKKKHQKVHPKQRKPAAKGDHHRQRKACRKHPRGTSLMVQGKQSKGHQSGGDGSKGKQKLSTKRVPTSGPKSATNFFFKLVLLGAILFSVHNIGSEILDSYPALKNAAGQGNMKSVPLLLLAAGCSAVVFGLFSSRGKLKRGNADT